MSVGDLVRQVDPIRLWEMLEQVRDGAQDGHDRRVVAAGLALRMSVHREPYRHASGVAGLRFIDLLGALNGFSFPRSDKASERLLRIARHKTFEDLLEALDRLLSEQNARVAQLGRERVLEVLVAPYESAPTIYVARPHTRVAAATRAALDGLSAEVETLLRGVARQRTLWWPGQERGPEGLEDETALDEVRVVCPALCDIWGQDEEEAVAHVQRNGPNLWRASFLCALATGGGSHGTGSEWCGVTGLTLRLWVHLDDGPVPPSVRGDEAGQGTDVRVVGWGDAARAAARYLNDNWRLFERHWQIVETRRLLYADLAQAFTTRLQGLGAVKQQRLQARYGVDDSTLRRLKCVDGLAGVDGETQRLLASALNIDTAVTLPPRPLKLSELQLDWWLLWAKNPATTAERANAVRQAATRQLEAGVLRFALTSRSDWESFDRSLEVW